MKKKKGFLAEFKEFISRGSVIDLAVGIIIGGAFTAIVNSLVQNLLTPVLGWILSGVDFNSLKYVIAPAADGVEELAITYGTFIQSVINFILVAFVVFLLVKFINALRRKKDEEAPAPAAPDPQLELLGEIRDLLKKD